jgi:hypothetical protein
MERGLSWTAAARDLAGATAGGLLIASIEYAVTRGNVEPGLLAQAQWFARLSAHWILASLPMGLAFLFNEYRAGGSRPSRSAYVSAVVLGAAGGAIVLALHGRFVDPVISQTAVGFDMGLADRFLYGLWQLGFWGSIGAVMHSTDLEYRLSAGALRRSELARLVADRRMTEARLAALQGQIEPEFVLATLGSIEQLYQADLEAADRILDGLIRFLRLAVPRLRGSTSTIGGELELLDAYLEVLRALPDRRIHLAFDVDSTIRSFEFPPGLLLSLVRRLHADGYGTRYLGLRSGCEATDCHLDLDFTPSGPAGDGNVRAFVKLSGRRLAMLRGRESTISILSDGPQTATVRIHLGHYEGDSHVPAPPS